MTDFNPSVLGARLGRRTLLRNSLLAVGAGAVLAACGDRAGNTGPAAVATWKIDHSQKRVSSGIRKNSDTR